MICGKARHGKNELAERIQEKIKGSKLYSLALGVKVFSRVMGFMKEKDGRVLQLVGTDLYRSLDEDFWLNILKLQIEEENPRVAIVTDGRFPNEKKFGDENGMSIRIIRTNEDGSIFISNDRPADHESECALDNESFPLEISSQSGDKTSIDDYSDDIADMVEACFLQNMSVSELLSYRYDLSEEYD